jgi:very-short-patch-repair endonuclease
LVIELAVRQRGAFAAWQIGDLPSALRTRRLQDGLWICEAPGVYRLASAPTSFDQRVWIGWLAAGPDAYVSHEAASEFHGLRNVIRNRVTLIAPHGSHHRIAGVTVSQIDDVLPEHIVTMRGLPVTSAPRTVVDLASKVGPVRLLHIVEDSKFDGLARYTDIGQCLASVARRGKPGVRALTRVLDQLEGGRDASQSKLERTLRDLIRMSGLAMPVAQFPLPGRQFVKGCVDFAYVEEKLIVEADGRRWHSRIRDLKRDHERDGDAAEAGWQTLRLLYEEITGDPEGTVRRLRAVLETRRAQLAS